MEVSTAQTLIIGGLLRSNRIYNHLGSEAIEDAGSTNQYSEMPINADIVIGRAVVGYLDGSNANAKIYSEETAKPIDVGTPKNSIFLDDLDGSGVAKSSFKVGRYGTMMAIFDGEDPNYEDYLAAGIMEHSPIPRLFYAVKGQGVHVLTWDEAGQEQKKSIKTSSSNSLNANTIVTGNDYFEIDHQLLRKLASRGIPTLGLMCSATVYADVAEGRSGQMEIDVVAGIESTRKGNLEIIIGYPLVIEAGGVVRNLDGEDLDPKKCLTYSQHPEDTQGNLRTLQSEVERTPIISAANEDIFMELQRMLRH